MDFPTLELETPRARMRVLRPIDVHDGYISGLNDPAVNRFLVNVKASCQTRESVEQFVSANLEAPDAMLFGIWEASGKAHAGTVRLHQIEPVSKSAHIGICLFDRAAWGKRIGTHAIRVLTAWAQESLDLEWIEAGVYEGNDASQRAFVAAGYDWICDVGDRYLFEGRPIVVHIYAARRNVHARLPS